MIKEVFTNSPSQISRGLWLQGAQPRLLMRSKMELNSVSLTWKA